MRKRVLIVEDEVDAAQLLQLGLEQTGEFQVRVANTSAEGLAAAAEFEPELGLLDVMLPDMDGGEVAARLRADPKLNHVPIIFLTAAVRRAEVSSRKGKIGGLTFLAKPVDLPELVASVKEQLERTSAVQKPAATAKPSAVLRDVRKASGGKQPPSTPGVIGDRPGLDSARPPGQGTAP